MFNFCKAEGNCNLRLRNLCASLSLKLPRWAIRTKTLTNTMQSMFSFYMWRLCGLVIGKSYSTIFISRFRITRMWRLMVVLAIIRQIINLWYDRATCSPFYLLQMTASFWFKAHHLGLPSEFFSLKEPSQTGMRNGSHCIWFLKVNAR